MPSNYAADTVLQAVSILVTMLSEKKKHLATKFYKLYKTLAAKQQVSFLQNSKWQFHPYHHHHTRQLLPS